MSQQAWCANRPGGVRAYALLVLAVLVGLLAMHGLGPVAPLMSSSAVAVDHHAVTVAAASHVGGAACEDCVHVGHDEGGIGGHAEHADATCAAGGTSGAPAVPTPALAGVVTCPAVVLPASAATTTLGGRAPPSLSELQLLRI
ncbi:DUF6153 family protein [Streptomyces chryseus]|uniref:DUF6153 family protein n=1 Tax=Streptomyces chryseus TaxID=68186 RepID=UPI00110F91F4|nr:DUF6153 family protein [Streptomyces chryseus]GGX41989.1 hypothetical protein GCM10010353_66470 [Streptomyces chryseus]